MQTTKENLSIALMSIDTDLERGTSHGLVDVNTYPHVHKTMRRYVEVADSLLLGSSAALKLGYDPALSAANSASRYITSGDVKNRILRACCEAVGEEPSPSDIAIIVGSTFVSWQTTPEVFLEVVADDMIAIVQSIHPIRCKGPIADLMPYLVRIAGNVIVPGSAQTAIGAGRIQGIKDRAIGRAFNALAHQNYHGDNAHGQLFTDNPAWIPLAWAVAESAASLIEASVVPMKRESVARLIQQAIAKAMRACDIPVVQSGSA